MNPFFFFFAILAWLSGLGQALTTNILVPLYVYPSTGAWDTVVNAIKAYPSLTFQIIINPANGPGNSGTGYDDSWRTALSTINSYSNVETYGYVHCSYGAQSTNAVETNITTWQTWNTYTAKDISMTGIFFDETPDGNTAYMTTLATFAHSKLGSSSKIIFNPGGKVTGNDYFSLADHVVVFEDTASACKFPPTRGISSQTPQASKPRLRLKHITDKRHPRTDSTSVPKNNVPSQYASKASILIYSFQNSNGGTTAELTTWLKGMVTAGIGSVNIVDDTWNDANDAAAPASIGSVASILVAAQ